MLHRWPIWSGKSGMKLVKVRYKDSGYHLITDESPVAISQNNRRVEAFSAGWTSDHAYAIGEGLILLSLRHESGRRAAWFLDGSGKFITNSSSRLSQEKRNTIKLNVHKAVAQWSAICLLGIDGTPPISASTLLFIADVSADPDLIDPLIDTLCPAASPLVLENSAGRQHPAALDNLARIFGREIDAASLKNFFRQDLLTVQLEAARSGELMMPSPLDGAAVRADAVWCLEPDGLVFRFGCGNPQDCFFAVLYGFQMTLFGTYFPYQNMFMHVNDGHRAQIHRRLGARPERSLWKHAMQYADCLPSPAMERRRPVILRSYDHIGHHVWNELASLDDALRHLGSEAMPPVIVADPDAVEMYGKIDDIFPELAGKVSRVPTVRAGIEKVYRDGLMPLRPTGDHIARSLAERISRLAAETYFAGMPERLVTGVRAAGFRLVILGLRVENRTVVDFPGFCEQLVEMLAQELGRVAVIVDGQNASHSGLHYRVTFQETAQDPPLRVEKSIVERLAERFANRPDVIMISTIGLPVGASIALCNQAEFFVTPWGAGLAKYRWVCNRRGLALVGPTCERLQPVHLYDDPAFIEAPAPMYFMGTGEVEDAPDDPVLLPGGNPDRVNIRVNLEALRARLRAMIAELPQQP